MSFDHVAWRPLPYSRGVEIGSDWQDKTADDPVFGIYTTCGFFSRAEVALLEQIARQFPGDWLEIGAHTGWCTAAIAAAAGNNVVAVEPMLRSWEWYRRFAANLGAGLMCGQVMPWAGKNNQYFYTANCSLEFDGCLIDGDHEAPHPLNDARCCYARLKKRGVIILHDFRGGSIWVAGRYLADQGMQWRVYPSVNMIFAAWRGDFDPPPDIHEGPDDWAAHYGLPEWAK